MCGGYYGGYIIKTTNAGNNWNVIYSNSDYEKILKSVYFTNLNTGYAVGGNQGFANIIVKTTNGGANWITLNSGSNLELKSVCFVNDTVGYICGLSGLILKTTTGGEPIGIKPISNSVPLKFKLYQNYPNPFNPYTKIKFEIPIINGVTNGNVKLIIYDILGREVDMLVNENLKPGSYEVTWDASKFASGIYFCRLITGEFIESIKIIFLK
jgi:hypothetical protein